MIRITFNGFKKNFKVAFELIKYSVWIGMDLFVKEYDRCLNLAAKQHRNKASLLFLRIAKQHLQMKRFTVFVISLLSIFLNSDCTKEDIKPENVFNEYLLDTTSINGIIAPQVPTNILYLFKDCPLNNVLEKYFIAINGIFYQSATQTHTIYERNQNELHKLVNKGILNNGNLRENIAAETTLLLKGLSDLTKQVDKDIESSKQLLEELGMDISKLTTGKVNTITLTNVLQSIRQVLTRTYQKITDRWILLKNGFIIKFNETDSSALVLLGTASTPVELQKAIESSVKTIKQSDLTNKFEFQNAENEIAHIIFSAEQDIVNLIQSLCVDVISKS